MRKLRQRLVARGSERVDPQVKRRTACKRGAFGRAFIAEHALQMRVEPLRIIAFHISRRTGARLICERRGLFVRQRCWRIADTVAERGNGLGVESPLPPQHTDESSARAVLPH